MSRRYVTLLIFALTLLASSCSNQSAFEPSQPTLGPADQQANFSSADTGDDPKPRKSPGGSRGGWK
jgi:hypothetical protein